MVKAMLRRIFPSWLWSFCCRVYYSVVLLAAELKWMFSRNKLDDPKTVPIIINNFNRLSDLKRLIDSLVSRGYENIHILDNDSSYPPLLEYYDNCPFDVIRLGKNHGFQAIWQSGVYERFKDSYYVYTDSDMEIDECCPDDFMAHFIGVFKRHPLCHKVGFGLRIDNLPDCYAHKEEVIRHESEFWEKEVESGVYDAVIDTTFALYRPYTKGASSPYKFMCRTGHPYLINHLPWHLDLSNLDEEEAYYANHIAKSSTHWSEVAKSEK